MHNFKHVLNEKKWSQAYSVYAVLKKHPGTWVHFTQVNKIGVNPNYARLHGDAPGIYFYPTDWVIANSAVGYHQYGLTHPNFYIAKPKSDCKIINLDTLTEQEGRRIAQENGWVDTYDNAMRPENISKWCYNKQYVFDYEKVHYGAKFFVLLSKLCGKQRFQILGDEAYRWLQLLKGYDGISDTKGVFMPSEPEQMVIFSKFKLDIVKAGSNVATFDKLKELVVATYKACGKKPKFTIGKSYYMHGLPTIELTIDSKPIRLTYNTSLHITGSYLGYEISEQVGSVPRVSDNYEKQLANAIKDALNDDILVDNSELLMTASAIKNALKTYVNTGHSVRPGYISDECVIVKINLLGQAYVNITGIVDASTIRVTYKCVVDGSHHTNIEKIYPYSVENINPALWMQDLERLAEAKMAEHPYKNETILNYMRIFKQL